MQCKDVMLTLVFRCRKTTPVIKVAQMMRDEKLGFLPVLDDRGVAVGVITDRDLVMRVLAQGRPDTTPVGDVMTPGPLLTCSPDESLRALERRMSREKKGRALVQDSSGALVGVISLSDIAKAEWSTSRTGRLLRDVTHRESVAIVRV